MTTQTQAEKRACWNNVMTALTSPMNSQHLLAIIHLQNAIATARMDLNTVMQVVVERAGILTGASGAIIELIESDEMVYRAVSGSALPNVGLRLKRNSSLSGRCVEEGISLRADDTETDPRVNREACRRVGIGSMIVVPLLHNEKPVGVLKVLSERPHAFGDDQNTTLELLAGVIAASMSHATDYELALHDSTHDALTGISNRRAFVSRLDAAVAFHERYRMVFSLALLDLDNFKQLNDRYGHDEGDKALRRVAMNLKKSLRKTDEVFRIGGDEFAILMFDTSLAAAQGVVERLVSTAFTGQTPEGILGLSAGVAESTGDGVDQLLKRVDEALYAVKRAQKMK